MARLVAAFAAPAALAPASASAMITSVFGAGAATISGNAVPCAAQSAGVRACRGDYNAGPGSSDVRLYTWDKAAALEVYVILPPAPGSGSEGPYPLRGPSSRLGRKGRRHQRHRSSTAPLPTPGPRMVTRCSS